MQHVNNLTVIIAIQKKHDIMRNEKYLITAYNVIIIYFKILIKHLNIKKEINVIKTVLLNSYFNE